jgi:hypothetical protein
MGIRVYDLKGRWGLPPTFLSAHQEQTASSLSVSAFRLLGR